jgi:hypothetical protein
MFIPNGIVQPSKSQWKAHRDADTGRGARLAAPSPAPASLRGIPGGFQMASCGLVLEFWTHSMPSEPLSQQLPNIFLICSLADNVFSSIRGAKSTTCLMMLFRPSMSCVLSTVISNTSRVNCHSSASNVPCSEADTSSCSNKLRHLNVKSSWSRSAGLVAAKMRFANS